MRHGSLWSILLLLLLCGPGSALATTTAGRLAPAKGVLLVAAESIVDPRFARSVVLLISHDVRGVSGVIVNRPSDRTLGETFAREHDLRGNEQPLFYGGPVASGTVTCLWRTERPAPEAVPIIPGLSLIRLERVIPLLKGGAGTERLRVVSGFAGWSAAQLAGEVERGDWYVLPTDVEQLFDTPPEKLWETLRRRGNELWI